MNKTLPFFAPILKNTPYFTKQNLGLALQKEGENLNYWIKKLITEGILLAIKKGFYISSYYLDLVSQNPVEVEAYLEYLANLLRRPSYVSLEYVLAKENFLAEGAFALTSVTIKSSRVYKSPIGNFIYKNLKESLFAGYQSKDFKDKKIKIASLPKALFDYLYLKKTAGSSKTALKKYLFKEARFNWDTLSIDQKKEFVKLIKTASSKKMQRILTILQEAKIL